MDNYEYAIARINSTCNFLIVTGVTIAAIGMVGLAYTTGLTDRIVFRSVYQYASEHGYTVKDCMISTCRVQTPEGTVYIEKKQ